MGSTGAERGQKAANAGITALKQGKRDKAGSHFNEALEHFESIEDDCERGMELSVFAQLVCRMGFWDLALMAAQTALEIHERSHQIREVEGDLITCGNVHSNLNNIEEALSFYRHALELCLANGHLDNGASAGTNLAGLLFNQGEMSQAIDLLYLSLDYVRRQNIPSTEIITRLMLTQGLEIKGRPPEEVFAIAGPLAGFAQELRPDQWEVLRDSLERSIVRYVKDNPGADPLVIKQNFLPGLFEE